MALPHLASSAKTQLGRSHHSILAVVASAVVIMVLWNSQRCDVRACTAEPAVVDALIAEYVPQQSHALEQFPQVAALQSRPDKKTSAGAVDASEKSSEPDDAETSMGFDLVAQVFSSELKIQEKKQLDQAEAEAAFEKNASLTRQRDATINLSNDRISDFESIGTGGMASNVYADQTFYPSSDVPEETAAVVSNNNQNQTTSTAAQSASASVFLSELDFRKDIETLSCSGINATTVSDVSQLDQQLFGQFRVICFEPGDYRSAGILELSLSGSQASPRVLRGVGEFDGVSASILPPIIFNTVQHWVVQGLSWAEGGSPALSIESSQSIVVSQNSFQQLDRAISISGQSDSIVVQDNWILAKNTAETSCIKTHVQHDFNELSIVGNQLNNCNTGIELVQDAGLFKFLIADNDLHWLKNEGCVSSALSLDTHHVPIGNSLVVANRISNWRSSEGCAAMAGAIRLRGRAENIVLEKNVLWGNQTAVAVAEGAQDILIRDNLMAGNATEQDESALNATVEISGATEKLTIINNHIVGSRRWLFSEDSNINLNCNVVLDGGVAFGATLTAGTINQNAYFATNPSTASAPNGSDQLFAKVDWANMHRVCFVQNLLMGDSEVCIDNALQSRSSPQVCGSSFWFDNES